MKHPVVLTRCAMQANVRIPYDITVTLKNKKWQNKNNSSVSLDCGYAGATTILYQSAKYSRMKMHSIHLQFLKLVMIIRLPFLQIEDIESAYGFEDLNPGEISSWFDLKMTMS